MVLKLKGFVQVFISFYCLFIGNTGAKGSRRSLLLSTIILKMNLLYRRCEVDALLQFDCLIVDLLVWVVQANLDSSFVSLFLEIFFCFTFVLFFWYLNNMNSHSGVQSDELWNVILVVILSRFYHFNFHPSRSN